MTMISRVKPWHVLVCLYLLAVLAVTGLLAREEWADGTPASIAQVDLRAGADTSTLLIHGGGLSSGLRAVMAEVSGHEDVWQWHVLDDMPMGRLAVSEREDLAVVSLYGSKLLSLALDRGEHPVVLDSLDLPKRIFQVRIVGDLAVVGMSDNGGVALVNLGNPREMRLVSILASPGVISDMVVVDDVIYFVDMQKGIGSIDLGAATPGLEWSARLKSPWRLSVDGDRMVALTLDGRAHLYEIKDRGRLRPVGSFDTEHKSPRDLECFGDSLAVAQADGHLHLYSLSGWPKVEPLSLVLLPGRPKILTRVSGRRALVVTLVEGGLAYVDLTHPERPELTGHLLLPDQFYDTVIRGELFYASGHSGLGAIPVAEIARSGKQPDVVVARDAYEFFQWNGRLFGFLGEELTPLAVQGAAARRHTGPYLAVADDNTVFFFAMNDAGEVSPEGSRTLKKRVKDALWHGDRLYLAHPEGLEILTGSTPDDLAPAGSVALAGMPVRLALLESGKLLAVTQDSGLQIIDAADAHRPVVLGSQAYLLRQAHSVALEVQVVGPMAYVSLGNGGVHAFNLRDPAQPQLMQVIQTPDTAKGLVLHDGLLLICDDLEGVFIVDIKDTDTAMPVGILPTPARARRIAIGDDHMLINNLSGGTSRVPLPQRLENIKIENGALARATVKGPVSRAQLYLYDTRVNAQATVTAGGG